MTHIKWKQKKAYKEKLFCKLFGHKFKETEYLLPVLPTDIIDVKSNLEICTRCKSGKLFKLFGAYYYTPEAVMEFVNYQNAKMNADQIKLLKINPKTMPKGLK